MKISTRNAIYPEIKIKRGPCEHNASNIIAVSTMWKVDDRDEVEYKSKFYAVKLESTSDTKESELIKELVDQMLFINSEHYNLKENL